MKIEVFAIAYNEEKIMPYFMRHYKKFADVTIYDNRSTDNTVTIAKMMGANVIPYDSGGKLNDQIYIQIKNNCWKNSKADWVIVCDADEFVYHPDLKAYLSGSQFTVYEPTWYEMFSLEFPQTNGQIYEVVKRGYEAWPKMNLFRPLEIKEINYEVGCHIAHPEGNVILNHADSEIKTLHMRHLGKQYIIERNGMYAKRLSSINKRNGWGWHLTQTAENLSAGFDSEFQLTKEVI